MALATENIALKAENARLREALDRALHNTAKAITQFENKVAFNNAVNTVYERFNQIEVQLSSALAQPTPTTPATDKAQEVIDAALTHRTPEWSKSRFIAAVEAYRGGA